MMTPTTTAATMATIKNNHGSGGGEGSGEATMTGPSSGMGALPCGSGFVVRLWSTPGSFPLSENLGGRFKP